VSTTRSLHFIVALAASSAFLAGACGHDIGDSCKTAADCDPNGTRTCDLSQPGGYCTMAGCDEKSCPSNSVCIRYFPENLLVEAPRCQVLCEDVGVVGTAATGCPQGRTDTCAADELCLDSGVCAKRSYETHACAHTCGDDGDCRGGYECRPASSTGMMLLGQTASADANVCAPKVP
jgi:hypothetical protein